MRIIGIDPGTRETGVAIIEIIDTRRVDLIHCGSISIPSTLEHQEKLFYLSEKTKEIIDGFKPDLASIEGIFAKINIQAAFKVGQARGVILLALAEKKIRAVEFSPREVKKSITGNGNADKSQVSYMIKQFFNVKSNLNYDSTDAAAIAMTLFHKLRSKI